MTDTRLAILESGFGLGGYIPRAISETADAPIISTKDADSRWMAQALLAAMEGVGRSSPNPSVGAIIVQGEECLSRGATEIYGGLHAERVALKAADVSRLKGSTCYVTLEPCGGVGKQPPCAEALIAAGVSRVVVAANDPHVKAAGLGVKNLLAAGIQVDSGSLDAEAKAWHFPFLASQIKKAPIIIGKWAQTLDGHLADDNDVSQWISGAKSRIYTHWLRQKYDAIMVGVGTVLSDSPRLTARDTPPPHARDPQKIVFDPSGRLATASTSTVKALFDSTKWDGPIVFWCTDEVQASRPLPDNLLPFKDRIEVVSFRSSVNIDFDLLFNDLSSRHLTRFGRELQSILVEGGAQLLTLLTRADQLDACHVFLRAGILGGTRNRMGHMNRGENPSLPLMDRRDYKLLATQAIDDDVLLEAVHRRYNFWDK